ncbi:hypothetical protein TMatcc_001304 [Talaromyces marneffei ATCC 18224]
MKDYNSGASNVRTNDIDRQAILRLTEFAAITLLSDKSALNNPCREQIWNLLRMRGSEDLWEKLKPERPTYV